MKTFKLAVTALVVALGMGQVSAADYKAMTIRAATANPDGSLHTTAINKFKEVIEAESGGKIKVQTFYGGSMGDEQANVRQLRSQEIHLAVLAVGNLTPFAPQANIFYMPYMFPEIGAAYKLLGNEAFTTKVGDKIAAQSGTRPLSWLIGGYRHLTNSKRPITNIDDLKGLKIRVPPVAVQLESFKAWGAEAHPLAWSETFNALQQGVIDGQENPHTVNRDQKFWEVQKHITELSYMLWVGPMLVSEAWYKGLDANTKALVNKAAKEAAATEWKWAAEQDSVAKKQCLDKGMTLSVLTDGPVWQEKARAIWPKFYEQVGGKAMLDEAVGIMSKK